MGLLNSIGNFLKNTTSNTAGGMLFGMGTSALGSVFSNILQRGNQNAANAWSEKMNLQQQEWQEKMWNMNNEYNSPAAQVDRLIAAGVNPNSAVGGMSQNATATMAQQPIIPNSNPMQGPSINLMDGAIQGAQLGMLDAQKANIEADTAVKLQDVNTGKAEEAKKQSEKTYIDEQAAGLKIDNANKQEIYDLQKAELQSRKDLTDMQKRDLQYMLEEIRPLEKKYTIVRIAETVQSTKESVSRTALNYEYKRTEQQKQGLLGAQTELTRAQTTGQNIENRFAATSHYLMNLKSFAEIRNLKLDAEYKAYLQAQLNEYGFNVSESDMDPIVKTMLLSNLPGYGKGVDDAKKLIGNWANILNSDDIDTALGVLMSVISSAATSYVGGRGFAAGAKGTPLGKSMQNYNIKHESKVKNGKRTNVYHVSSSSHKNP